MVAQLPQPVSVMVSALAPGAGGAGSPCGVVTSLTSAPGVVGWAVFGASGASSAVGALYASDTSLQADGRILVAGTSINGSIVDFALARNEAVLRATNVSVCTSTNLTSCTNSGWGSGRLVFVDGGALGTVDGGDQILSVTRTLNNSLTTSASGVATANVITYSALGRTAGVGQITVCATGQTRRNINLRASGSATLDRTAIAC